MADDRSVTLIIPTANRRAVLPLTLPSYLTQRGVAEVVLVNDGGEPLTDWVAEAFPETPVPLRVVEHPRNLGLCAARNSGIAAARTEHVLMGEDDVLFEPDHVATLLREKHRVGADLIAGVIYRPLGNETALQARARAEADPRPQLDLRTLRLRADPVLDTTREVLLTHALTLSRRELASRILFDTKLSGPSFYREDNEFCLAARRRGARIFVCPDAVAIHLPRELTGGGGCRTDRFPLGQALSSMLNSLQLVDEYTPELRDGGYAGSVAALKRQVAARAAWSSLHPYLSATSPTYARALALYRAARRRLRGAHSDSEP